MTGQALREIFQLQREIDGILALDKITGEQRKRADLLMAKIASVRDMGMSTDEAHRTLAAEYGKEIEQRAEVNQHEHEAEFRRFLNGERIDERATTFIAGTESVTYTQGPTGGYLVPQKFYQSAAEGMAAIDPLLDPNVVTVISEPDYSLRPLQLPGWDLSSVAAVKVGEVAQESAATVPSIDQLITNKFGYRVAFDASAEWDNDQKAYGDPMAALGRACGVAMARGIGADLVTGNGSTAPQGIRPAQRTQA